MSEFGLMTELSPTYNCWYCGSSLFPSEAFRFYKCKNHAGIAVAFWIKFYTVEVSYKNNSINYNIMSNYKTGEVSFYANHRLHYIPNYYLCSQTPEEAVKMIDMLEVFS